MAHAFFLGVDLEESSPESLTGITLSILEKEKNSDDEPAQYRLDHIRHYTEEISADVLADRIQGEVSDQPYIGRTSIIINRENEGGRALIEALQERGLDPVGASFISGSGAAAGERDEVSVQLGTADVVRALADLYREGRFVVEEHSTEAASRLARGVQNAYEVLDEAEGDQVSGASDGGMPEFDDGVDTHLTSAGLAAWLGQELSFDPAQHFKEPPQTDRSPGGPEV